MSLHAWVMGSDKKNFLSLRQTFDQSFMKIFQRVQEIRSEQERDGWPSNVTLTLSLHQWVIGSTYHLTKANIWPKFNKAVWMAMERPHWPWPWVSIAELWVLHIISLRQTFWPTFKENPSRGKGDMEPTPNSRLKLVTFNCDLDLKSAGLSYGFCTLSQWGEHLTKV